MITTSIEENLTTKEGGKPVDEKNSRGTSSTSTTCSRPKDPRIVRVSRAFGGKDRHSKVCTVRGLRDRRVRLSVPTAIQLYDLQDRLGLNQPSKVVDWLLNAAKSDIDELPPLQMPPGNNNVDWDNMLGLSSTSHFWNSDTNLRGDKAKEITTEATDDGAKGNWNRRNDEEKQHVVSSNPSFIPGLLNNVIPYNPFYRLDPGNFSSSHLGSHGFTPQTEDFLNFNFVPISGVAQPYFHNSHHVAPTSVGLDPKQINHFQMLSSSSQNPMSASATPILYSLGQSMKPNNTVDFPPKS